MGGVPAKGRDSTSPAGNRRTSSRSRPRPPLPFGGPFGLASVASRPSRSLVAPAMQPPSNGVVIHMQPYSDGKEGDGGARPGGAPVPQILKVRDYVVWSLFNFAFWNFCCLGLVAVLFSVKSRDHKVVGDAENASYYGRRAKWLNIILMILSIVFIAIFIVLIVNGEILILLRERLAYSSGQEYRQLPPPDWNKYSGK